MKITLKDSDGKWVDIGWEVMDDSESKLAPRPLFWIDTECGECVTLCVTPEIVNALSKVITSLQKENKKYTHDTN